MLVQGFGLDDQSATIQAAFDTVLRHSLDFPLGTRPSAPSHLNEDGAPVQFATLVGVDRPGLRFVGDVGPIGQGGEDRHLATQDALRELAGIIGMRREIDGLKDLLDRFAPKDNPALRRDPAGAFWLGLAFAPGATPRLRLYLNGTWGGVAQRWARIAAFAARFGQAQAWDRVREQLPVELKPLGFAVTLAPGKPAHGTLYLRAFGLRPADYQRVARLAAGPAVASAIGDYAIALLGDEVGFPAPAAVMSFGLGSFHHTPLAAATAAPLTAELELCGHCLFRDDREARARVLSAIAGMGLDPGAYLTLAEALMTSPARPVPPRVHSFVGVNTRSPKPALTVYMKPDLFA